MIMKCFNDKYCRQCDLITFFNFIFTLFKSSLKISELRLKNMLPERLGFVKINSISEEKNYSVIKKNLELRENKYQFRRNVIRNLRNIISFIYEHQNQCRTVILEIMHKMQTSFKTLASKKATKWQLNNLKVSAN